MTGIGYFHGKQAKVMCMETVFSLFKPPVKTLFLPLVICTRLLNLLAVEAPLFY